MTENPGDAPTTEWFEAQRRRLEDAYIRHEDPIRQSGFSGGPVRWRREREPILEAVDADRDLLDVGFGVLFEINPDHLPKLHQAEGPGYRCEWVIVTQDSERHEASHMSQQPI